MKKDIQWLEEKIGELPLADTVFMNSYSSCYVASAVPIMAVYDLIDQLDEPETDSQIDELANFIMREVEGEPSQSQGAVDTAIRIIKSYQNQEAMSIDKEQLIKRIENYIPLHDKTVGDVLDGILEIIKQLPELEVLSWEWVDEHAQGHWDEWVYIEDLQSLLVPKQEEMKVSKTWHDVIAQNKEEGHSLRWTLNYIDNLNVNDVDEFAGAWLAYPDIEVEEEQKYNVSLKLKSSFETVGIFLYKEGDEVLAGDNFGAYDPKDDECRLTEQEIRGFQNGDILFEHFAVKAEELEE